MKNNKESLNNENPLSIKHTVTTLSKGRLGMYLNRDIVRSLGIEAGTTVYISVPDKKHLILKLQNG